MGCNKPQTYIPTEKFLATLTYKQFYQRIRDRLSSMRRSIDWLRERLAERGLPTNYAKLTPAQRLATFEVIEEERRKAAQ